MGEKQAENLMIAYQNLNGILCAFVNHSLPGHDFTIRERTLQEKVLNYEFSNRNPYQTLDSEQSIFFVGKLNQIEIYRMNNYLFNKITTKIL